MEQFFQLRIETFELGWNADQLNSAWRHRKVKCNVIKCHDTNRIHE